ncbi:MAG TPA: hydrolase [Methylococcaceae bacterium]|nr:hydrolase [Methylococcaceae bacterium]
MIYQSPWWLKTAHLQTVYPALCRKPAINLNIRRERLRTPDNDFIDIDFCGEGRSPLVILLHGLTGSSQSGYIKGLQTVFRQQGWRSVALNFRGCSGEPNQLARCYHSGDTEDIDFLYRILRQREPETSLAAVGFSLGGNVLLKWLGEQGSNVTLSSAVAVSVPLVLNICATKLDRGFSKIYRDRLLVELKEYLDTKLNYLVGIGRHEEADKIQRLGDLSSVKSFWQYDDRVVARLHGFEDVHDYYRRSSSRQYLKAIRVPTLLIQAFDDPFMTPAVLPSPDELSPSVMLEVTQGGGHVGFVEGCNPLKPKYWLERRIPRFIAEQGFS